MSTVRTRSKMLKDGNSYPFQTVPAIEPLAVTYDATIDASTEVTLQGATKLIEISAIDKPIVFRWGTSDASVASAGMSGLVQAGATRHYPVPAGVTAINFIEQAGTAKLVLVEYA